MDAIGFILGGLAAGTVWFGVCNERTYKQRERMIDIVHSHNVGALNAHRFDDAHDYPDEFVSYSGHLLRLFAFLDPYKVYRVRGWRLEF